MIKRAIATRYANALFALAEEKGILDDIEKDFPGVAEVIASSGELAAFLSHPAISPDDKKTLLADLFKGKVHEVLFDLLQLTVDKSREEYIPLIQEDFMALLMEHRRQVHAQVSSPFPLSDDVKKEIAERLAKALDKTVIIDEVIDESLIGGIKVQIGDRVYDGSITSKLDQLRDAMLTTGV